MGDVRPRIAVVDDDLSVRRALERLLRASGFDAAVFASGHEFFYSLDGQAPDCLILDLHMPAMKGWTRRLQQTGVRLPVVVITGHDEPQTRTQCLDAGAAAYLCKPLNDEALIAAIQGAMRRSETATGSQRLWKPNAFAFLAMAASACSGPHQRCQRAY
jgi:FixJ family two-component response regulator